MNQFGAWLRLPFLQILDLDLSGCPKIGARGAVDAALAATSLHTLSLNLSTNKEVKQADDITRLVHAQHLHSLTVYLTDCGITDVDVEKIAPLKEAPDLSVSQCHRRSWCSVSRFIGQFIEYRDSRVHSSRHSIW